MHLLTIALPKGRILIEAVQLLRATGLPVAADPEASRRLILDFPEQAMRLILAKPTDVPTYVEYGAADLGIVGKDVLLEAGRDVVELQDLRIGRCRLSVAGLPEATGKGFSRVATKYPGIASRYFREKGRQVEVIQLNGSIELAPLTGLAEAIVDIVSSGKTLQENGLVEWETILPVTARLVANRVSYRMKSERLDPWLERLEYELSQGGRSR